MAAAADRCAAEDFRLSGVVGDPRGVSVESDEFHVDARIVRLSGVRDVRGGLVTSLASSREANPKSLHGR